MLAGDKTVPRKHLVRCSCGLELAVEPAQAGQLLQCTCGRSVQAPNLLDLRKLPLAPQEPPSQPRSTWGVRQRLISLGSLILIVALAWLGVLLLVWPAKPQTPETITWQTPPLPGQKEPLRKTTQQLTLLESYLAWQNLPRELESLSDAPMARYRKEVATAVNWFIVGCVVGVLGLGCLASGWLVPARTAALPRAAPAGKASR